MAGIKVQFEVYDVDDPSDHNGPIDDDRDDDDVGGPDNLKGGIGSLAQRMIQTDANGIALNQFTATRRPGDNYKRPESRTKTVYMTAEGVSLVRYTPRSGASNRHAEAT